MTNADRHGEIGRRRDALKVLCVDDEPSTLSLMSRLLERMDFAVTVLDAC
jgi:CheY-like chemotaxis protein